MRNISDVCVFWVGVQSLTPVSSISVTVVGELDRAVTSIDGLRATQPTTPNGSMCFPASGLPTQTLLRAELTVAPAAGPATVAKSVSTVLVDVLPITCDGNCTLVPILHPPPGFNFLPGYPGNITSAVEVMVGGLALTSPLRSAEYVVVEVGDAEVVITSGMNASTRSVSPSVVQVTIPNVQLQRGSVIRVVLVMVSESGTRSDALNSSDVLVDVGTVRHLTLPPPLMRTRCADQVTCSS